MIHDPDDVTRYRYRAEELRTIADGIKDQEYRKALLNWASEYDRMIEKAAGLAKHPTE